MAREIFDGKSPFGYNVRTSEQAASGVLFPRQLDILRLSALGMPNRQIAEDLGIAMQTVKNIKRQAYEALGVGTIHQAMQACRDRGIFEFELDEDTSNVPVLTVGEMLVLEQMNTGQNGLSKTIARSMRISPHTVKNHLRDARKRTGTNRSYVAAIIYDVQNGPVLDEK